MNNLPEPFDGSLNLRPVPETSVYANSASDFDDESADVSASSGTGNRVSVGLVWRAFRRYWWQVLVIWGMGSAALVTLAYTVIKPTYDAVARVRVEPGEQSLYTSKNTTPLEFAEFKETQVASVTSPVVLSLALTEHPELFQLPKLQRTEDAEAEIRRSLRVMIYPKTNLIDLSMSSQSPTEAAQIINAVLDAYLKNASSTSNEDIERRIVQLKADRDTRIRELESKRAEWRRLSDRIGAADTAGVKDRNLITGDDYRLLSDRLSQVEIERYATQAKLDQLRSEKQVPVTGQDQALHEQTVRDAFYADPRIIQLQKELTLLQGKTDRIKRISRNSRDPSLVAMEAQRRALKGELSAWWTRLRPRLERDITAEHGGENSDRAIGEAELLLASLKSQEAHYHEKLNQMKIKSRDAGGEGLQLEFVRHDTDRSADMLHKVEDNLNQLEHEARSPIARVRKEFPARPSNRPNVNHRTKLMALAPAGMLFLVMGFFVVIELRAGRVADPDEFSSRVRVQILGVVPPLPSTQASGGFLVRRDEFRMQRQLDEFVQSLDHLRVLLCARPDRWGRDRHCVLITSACGSEGKTTLAVQLAERCATAGLMTLLIDADLRNPSLSRMLDAAESDGLSNVLRDETAAEAAMMVIHDAGGFHFLPAGTPRTDPNRLLQGEALGKLLAQARESFDMIIVDAPPVLPVPDALTIGRWTDGAVLAVRYDTSRCSLVERAQRRLAHVRVPVIGAVVNGVRATESTYGGSYAYGGNAISQMPGVEG
ncbi:polysaccharide biosynthesis tyrosine autokinase (plasmid) [Singulisphaera sp. Ch08]|uniref:Polysaccharide biosynthesis tyrosine autokinase n=1 Tax=Singulisphaera sp. Ch08 TaxID=3120278 RepID=A0AAU7CTM0_9BACT